MSTFSFSGRTGGTTFSYSESILDASVSFRSRITTRLPQDETVQSSVYDHEQVDFLALMTAISNLYNQVDVLEMQCRGEGGRSSGMAVSSGAVGEVSAVYAALNNRHRTETEQGGVRRKHIVVLKRAAEKMFMANGDPTDPEIARSFVSEIRILSHNPLRKHANIVKLLGVHWDHIDTGCPEPLLVLEKADEDLAGFLERENVDHSVSSTTEKPISFQEKKAIALGIAQGLAAIHESGLIHGDIKPKNILLFRKPILHAKIADFSHSLLNTGETRKLVGGSAEYAAPEWQRAAPTGQLLKTDVYSFGLVFGELMLGCRIMLLIRRHSPPIASWPPLSPEEMLRSLKDENGMCRYLCNLASKRICKSLKDLTILDEDICLIVKVLESTVTLDHQQRDLKQVINLLDGGEHGGQKTLHIETIGSLVATEAISIPYSTFQYLSPVISDQVVRSLQTVSLSETDTRRGAAQLELAICHAACISCFTFEEFSSALQASQSFTALVAAARLGDHWARATLHRMSQALDQPIPADISTISRDWLFDEAVGGSRIALESLLALDPQRASEASSRHIRREMLGEQAQGQISDAGGFDPEAPKDFHDSDQPLNDNNDTLLHWLAAIGDEEKLEKALCSRLGDHLDAAAVNKINNMGDTPLLSAARTGHVKILALLLNHGADATITNNFNENPLHFLDQFQDADIPSAARMLLDAGADPSQESIGFSGSTYIETRPVGRSCPRLRAVFSNSPLALEALLSREFGGQQKLQRSDSTILDAGGMPSTAPPPTETHVILLAWALRLHHFRVLDVLEKYLSGSPLFRNMEKERVLVGSTRYSLVELCIMGCQASDRSSSGVNIPEPYVRMLNHGRNYKVALERSLEFLMSHEPRFFITPCGGARNPLFYAIQQGHHDAVSFLSSMNHPAFTPHEFFRTPCDPWARCRENSRLLGGLPPWGEDDLTWDEYKHGPTDPMPRKKRIRRIQEREQAVTNQREKMGRPLWFNVSSKTFRGFGADGPLGGLQEGEPDEVPDSESDDEEGRDDGCQHSSALRSIRNLTEPRNPWDTGDNPPSRPMTGIRSGVLMDHEVQSSWRVDIPNYRELEGEVDAVTASILHGRRKIFYDLLFGAAKKTMRELAGFQCYYVENVNLSATGSDVHRVQEPTYRGAEDLSYLFPRQASRFSVTTTERGQQSVLFNGVLRYPLSYMTLIARSIHRDLKFAKLLLDIMNKLNIPDPVGWSSTSDFEDACMAIDNAGGQTCPLYHASYLGWDELAILLMNRGASPGSRLWFRGQYHISRPRPMSVLSGLIELTRNRRGEVERLLLNTTTVGTFEQVVTARDIELLWRYPPGIPERPGLLTSRVPCDTNAAYWDMNGQLSYSDLFAKPTADYKALWDAIAIADCIQQRKVRERPGDIVVQAARHRDISALRTMILDMGLDPNQSVVEAVQFSVVGVLRAEVKELITATEVATCSASVPDKMCSERGLELKKLDATIANLLISAGGEKRGWLARKAAELMEKQTWFNFREEVNKYMEFEEETDKMDDWSSSNWGDWYPT